MVFLIQNSQNRDSAAIQVKLDELIRISTAHNSFVGIEHLTDDELQEIRTKCEHRAEAEKAGEASVKRTGKRQSGPRIAPWDDGRDDDDRSISNCLTSPVD